MAKEYRGVALDSIKRGQAWEPSDRGSRHFPRKIVRVMGVVDGYVVHRVKGCMPGITFWKDFVVNHARMQAFDIPGSVK